MNKNILLTANGTQYFRHPEVELVGRTQFVGLQGVSRYIESYPEPEYEYKDYLDDMFELVGKEEYNEFLVKLAGQICYQSHGVRRTKNADMAGYFKHIHESAHFSVLEHFNFTFLIYGVTRNFSSEMNRHRHLSISEKSQRYCNKMRFVERPEFQIDEGLHNDFCNFIDEANVRYNETRKKLLVSMKDELENKSKTDKIKAVNQVARTFLPGCTETVCVYTGNTRTWLELVKKRDSIYAETEIRNVAQSIHGLLKDFIVYDPTRRN